MSVVFDLDPGPGNDVTHCAGVALWLRERPEEIVARMTKSARRGKVFIDWSQNSPHKTTVAPFSLRARARPTVAVPLYWSEVEKMAGGAEVEAQLVEIDDVPAELDARAELFTPLLREHQDLPTDST